VLRWLSQVDILGMKKSQVNDITISYNDADDSPSSSNNLTNSNATPKWDEIYRQQAVADLSKLIAGSRRHRRWGYIMSALVFLIIGAIGSWLWLGRNPARFGEEAVQFKLTAPSELPSGQVVEYTLSYANNQAIGLKQVEINLRYPDGFTFADASLQPDNQETTRFIIPGVGPNQVGALTIRGQLIGDLNDDKKISALVVYEPNNIKAQFTKTLSFSTKLVASAINLDLAGLAKVAVDQPVTLAVKYHNSSTAKLVGLRLRLNLPGGFDLEVPSLEAESGQNNVWRLRDLEPQGDGKFELKGKFSSASQVGDQSLGVAIGFWGGTDKVFSVQEEKVWQVAVLGSQLSLNLTANDVSLKSQATLGQEIKYELAVVNNGDLSYSDFKLKVQLSTVYLDWSSWRDDFGGQLDKTAGTITWSGDSVPFLKIVQSKSRVTLTWRINTVTSLPRGAKSPVSFMTQVTGEAKQVIDNNLQTISLQSNQIETKFSSLMSLAVEGRYYTDQLVKLGSGPLPPRVGQTTTYIVFWQLGNTLNDLENMEVTATLPAGVNWTGQTTVSAGQAVTYNSNTREVSWRLNRLPAGAGITFTKPEAWFELAVTPEESDADKILVLTKTTTATARDSVSGADLIATAKFVTTELDDDLGAQGKGVVVR